MIHLLKPDIFNQLKELEDVSQQPLMVLSDAENSGSENCCVKSIDETTFCTRTTEKLADISDEVAELFLEDKILSKTEADKNLRSAISACKITPVVFGSAKYSVGIKELADILVRYMPDSSRLATDELCGIVFKIEHDKSLGKVTHIRLFGGEIANRDEVELFVPEKNLVAQSDAVETEDKKSIREKVSQIKKFCGAKSTDTGIICSGDVAAVCGLPSAKNGFYIGTPIHNETANLVNPFLRVRVTPVDTDPLKVPALAAALNELSDEEPYIDAKWENGQKEITISTTGKIQIEVLSNLLKERYNIDAQFSSPTVIYKETPSKAGKGLSRYTMPKWNSILSLCREAMVFHITEDFRIISAFIVISRISVHPSTDVLSRGFMAGK